MAFWSRGDIYTALEMVMCMVFTPSPSGWFEGIWMAFYSDDYAMENESNLVVCFIETMVNKYGHVSAGGGRRRMVSHSGSAVLGRIFKSLVNMLRLVELANTSDNTEQLLKMFTSSPEKGGVLFAGMLLAQEMINVLTKVGIITNHIHLRNATVAKGTCTSKRLVKYGIRTDNDREHLMCYLTKNLKLDREKVENGLCEALRSKGRKVFDTVGHDSQLYQIEDGVLMAYDVLGYCSFEINIPDWHGEISFFRGVQWWDPGYERKCKRDLREIMMLTNKNKKGC